MAYASRNIHAHSTDSLLNTSLLFAYGVTDTLTLGARLPYVQSAVVSAPHRLGGEAAGEHEDHAHGHHAFDAILEMNGDWQGRENMAALEDRNSGGTWLYLAPGVRYISPDRWAASASLGLPVWQSLNGVQAPAAYRVVAEVGKAF